MINGDCSATQQATTAKSPSGVVDIYCIKIVNGVCEKCSNGYYFSQTEKICKQADPLCRGFNNQTGFCTQCYQGFALTNGKCVVAAAVSIPHCLTNYGGKCT